MQVHVSKQKGKARLKDKKWKGKKKMSPRESSRGHENVELWGGTWHLFFSACAVGWERNGGNWSSLADIGTLSSTPSLPVQHPGDFSFFLLGCQKRAGPDSDQSEAGRACRKGHGDCLSLEGGWVGGCRSYGPFIPLASDPNSREVGSPS